MEDKKFLTVDEVAKEMSISKSYAYKIVKELNKEMNQMGYVTVAGRVNANYFNKKVCYSEAKESGVQRIRIHDLRHSAISLLIEMGFSALAIAERVGHESVDITYRYAHLFPTRQTEMADKLDVERMGKENEKNGKKFG